MSSQLTIKIIKPVLVGNVLTITDPDNPSKTYSFSIQKKSGEGGFGTVFVSVDPALEEKDASKEKDVPKEKDGSGKKDVPKEKGVPKEKEASKEKAAPKEKKYALKIFHPTKNKKTGEFVVNQSLFEREVKALIGLKGLPDFVSIHMYGAIKDRVILDVLGCAKVQKTFFIIMDCVEHNLNEWIKTLKTEEDVRILFRQICDRVLTMNTIGYTHRDLKSDNIMYDIDETSGERVVKLVDYGLAKQGDFSTCQGTNYYAAPEVYGIDPKLGHRLCPLADIWSLGAILLEILMKMYDSSIKTIDMDNDFYVKAPAFIDGITCVPWEKFPNCRVLLNRLLVQEDSRITFKELKEYIWLDLSYAKIVCERYKVNYDVMLGKGNFGSVFKGVDIKTERPVSIKRFPKPKDFSPEKFEKYSLAEISNLLKLKGHPNILEILGYERVEEIQYEKPKPVYYIVTELCNGTWERNKSKPPEKIPKECIQQMCNAVIYANVEMEMVHRDIKPANIMYVVGKDGRKVAKIIDWGLPKKTDLAETACGTPRFMAPELCNPNPLYPADKADIFSLGRTFEYYKDNGLLPDDFPLDAIEKMTKFNYSERISWEELMKIPYFGYVKAADKKVEGLLDYADTVFYCSLCEPYEVYGLYYAAYRLCRRGIIKASLVERCEEKKRLIEEAYGENREKLGEIAPEEFLIKEAFKCGWRWLEAKEMKDEERMKEIEETVLLLLNECFYLNTNNSVYQGARHDFKRHMGLKFD